MNKVKKINNKIRFKITQTHIEKASEYLKENSTRKVIIDSLKLYLSQEEV